MGKVRIRSSAGGATAPDTHSRDVPVVAARTLQAVGKKHVLGWKESVVLPDLGGARLPAKLDTGARTSALHAVGLVLQRQRGILWIDFDLPDVETRVPRRYRMQVVEHRAIKSSIGSRQIRPVVMLEVNLAGQTWTTEVTLTDRSDMELPMLIGRSALKGRFVVDPARTRLAERTKPITKRHSDASLADGKRKKIPVGERR